VVIFGFLRITTNSRSFQNPLSISEAFEIVRSWLAQPVVQVIEPTAGHIERTMKLLEALGTGGNLVTDAQIASLALEYGATVHTADADFLRFRGLSWFNPMTGTGGK
jgi:toxin-antitoxin system PIN domain toxin